MSEKPQTTNYVTTDEEFHAMLKEIHSVDMIKSPVLPLRKYRADRITSEIMQIVSKYLENDERNTLRNIHRDILDMFFKADVDIVTEIDRIEAGLPRHNAYGYTKEEMRIMELHRQKKMLEAMPPMFVVPEGKVS